MAFHVGSKLMRLKFVQQGITIEQVQSGTEFELLLSVATVRVTRELCEEQVRMSREEIDPNNIRKIAFIYDNI